MSLEQHQSGIHVVSHFIWGMVARRENRVWCGWVAGWGLLPRGGGVVLCCGLGGVGAGCP